MFTAKIVLPNGDENLFECVRVERVQNPIETAGGQLSTEPGILLHYEDGGSSHYGLTPEVAGGRARLFVMNRFGATVADYRL